MLDQRGRRAERLGVARLMDQANERFVEMSQAVMRLVTWQAPAAKREVSSGPTRGRTTRRPSSIEPQVFAALAEQVERILKRCRSSHNEDTNARAAQMAAQPDMALAEKLRDLFDGDASLRRGAARWIGRTRSKGGLSALESVLLIEEQHDVREEILRTLRALRPDGAKRARAGRMDR